MTDLEIFINAPDNLTDAELGSYFDEACGGDNELRTRVEALVAAQREATSFMESAPIRNDGNARSNPIIDLEQPGSIIGNYKLLQQIGEGGCGIVYMAEQLKPVKRRVALKIIKLGMDTKQVVARFEVERQALALMDHPNIAKVHDAGSTDTGRPFFVMELVKGIPITKFCDEHNLSTKGRLRLFIDVCHAVQHAHQKGVIHRDLKPSNVMVTLHDDKAVVKVIDFGVAKATHTELTDKTLYTRFEQFLGTPAYMSPEQAQLSGLDIDTRSDIYALGVLLYELLTGATPFDAKTLRSVGHDEIRRIIREEDPPKPSTRIRTSVETNHAGSSKEQHHINYRTLRGDLDWIVMKAIEKDRTRRYDTANGLAMDVERHLADEPVTAARPSVSYRLLKYVRRNRGLVASLATVFAVLTVGVIGTSVLFVEMRAQKEVAVTRGEEARLSEQAAKGFSLLLTEQKNSAAAESEIWKRQAYTANIMGAHLFWMKQKAGRARELLEACPEELRNWEWRWLWQLVDRNKLVAEGLSELLGAWYAPDGRSILSFREQGRYQLWDRASGEEQFSVDVGGSWIGWEGWRGTGGAFTMDGNEVFLGGTKAFGRWDLATGKQIVSFDEVFPINSESAFGIAFHSTPKCAIGLVIREDGALQIHEFTNDDIRLISVLSNRGPAWIFSVNFSRDGKFVALGQVGFSQWIYDVDSGVMVGTILGTSIAFGRGSEIVVGTGRESLSLHDTSTLKTLWEIPWETGQATSVEIAHDGRHVFVGGMDGNLVVRDATTGASLGTHGGHLSSLVSITESPDQSEILTASADGTIRVWPRETVTEAFIESLVLHAKPSDHRATAFSPDGTRLVSAGNDGMTKVWDTSTGQELLTIRQVSNNYPTADFNPDPGQHHVVTGGSGGEPLRIWDIDSGQPIRLLRGASHTRLVKYSPDGTRIAAAIGDTHILVWDSKTGKELSRIEHGAEAGLAFSPDGSKIAFSVTRNYDHLGICDAETGVLLKTLKQWGGAGFRTVTFSPDGIKLAVGGDDYIVRVWDVESGELLHQLKRHTLEVLAVAFSHDRQGSRLFTGGRDETLRVWDSESGHELLAIPTGSEIWGIAVSAGDKMVATSGGDGNIRLWETERPTPAIRNKRRIVTGARQLVDQRFALFSSPAEINESLFSDDSINTVLKKVALEILQARRGVRADPEVSEAP